MNVDVDTKLMKALAHPLRQEILSALTDRVASPSELADEIGEPLGNVSYHVRMLVDLDCIELVSTTPRRGALEHYYRATVPPIFDNDTWAAIPIASRRGMIADIMGKFWRDASAAAEQRRFDDPTMHATRHPLELDEQGHREMVEMLVGVMDRIQEIKSASAERLASAGPDAARVKSIAAIFHFQAPDPARKTKAKPKAARKTAKR